MIGPYGTTWQMSGTLFSVCGLGYQRISVQRPLKIRGAHIWLLNYDSGKQESNI
jgi:hypothetical protein